MSVAQYHAAVQVCAYEPDLSPLLDDGRVVPCSELDLFYTYQQLKRANAPIGETK